jgi:hypothetical protein
MNYKKGDVVELYYRDVPEYFKINKVGCVWVYVQSTLYANQFFKFRKNDPNRLIQEIK